MIDYPFSEIVCEQIFMGAHIQISKSWYVPIQNIASQQLRWMSKTAQDKNWKLGDFFESIYVINLSQATERLEKFTQELKGIGTTEFNIFPAIQGKNLDYTLWNKFYLNTHSVDLSTTEGKLQLDRTHQSQAGCYMSHYLLIKYMHERFEHARNQLETATLAQDKIAIMKAEKKLRKFSRVLIFEDDCGFGFLQADQETVSKKGAGYHFRKALQSLPKEWDMLYFVVNATEPTTEVSSHLRQLNRSWGLNAYAINYTMYAPLIEHLKKIEDPSVTKVWPVDDEIGDLHPHYKVFAISPSIVFSQEGQSFISEKTWKRWQGQPIYPSEL